MGQHSGPMENTGTPNQNHLPGSSPPTLQHFDIQAIARNNPICPHRGRWRLRKNAEFQ
jgi:hypothetical protein